MQIDTQALACLMKGGLPRAQVWQPALTMACERYAVATPARLAAFLAQLAHESDGFSQLVENFHYTAARLCAVWPHRFFLLPDEPAGRLDADEYAGHPELIANTVYADRMGNGPVSSGDGWRYRGRGLLQISGRNNYGDAAQDIGVDVLLNPDLLVEPLNAAMSAAAMWQRIGANELADADTAEAFGEITFAINGGTEGMDSRVHYWQLARRVIQQA